MKLCLIFLLLSISKLFAIIDMEVERTKGLNKTFYHNIAIALSGSKGNSNKQDIDIDLFHSFRKEKWHLFLTGQREFGKSNGQKSTDINFAHFRTSYYHTEGQAIELFYQYSSDQFKNLIRRNLFGAGYRFEFINLGAIGLALFQEFQKYKNKNESQMRANLYTGIDLKIVENVFYAITIYYQPVLNNPSDWRSMLKSSLSTMITNSLKSIVSFTWEQDSMPEEGIEKSDFNYKFGFAYNF
ncbi:MAG: DUF481 domain-containing protein [Halobacteriovoraceae bacterium]|nr:DUF481 domain-containing protein [Halobacteriovoraceae bacterium]